MQDRPPIKLEWTEQVAEWLRTRGDLPCSLAGGLAVVLKLAHAADSDGTNCRASARWLEAVTKVNATRIRAFLDLLIESGWLAGQRLPRRVPVFIFTFPSADHPSADKMATADTSADTSADTPSADDVPSADTSADDTSPTTGPPGITDHRPPGLVVAIEEARADPSVTNPEGAGRWRYNQNPERYDQEAARRAEHQACTRCGGRGTVEEYAPGAGMVTVTCPGEAV